MFRGETAGTCGTGGGAEAAFRLSRQWQFVVDISGCDLVELGPNTSGDALNYLVGPRWTPSQRRLRPYAQFLVGGVKVSTEEVFPEKRKKLETAAQPRDDYALTRTAHGLAISAGTGLDLKLARAAAVKLASIEYTRSWTSPINGVDYNRGLALKLGLTLRMGTW
jgi:hypothetical protein